MTRFAPPPAGPVYESYPVMRAAPAMVAMPMMMMGTQMRVASFDDTAPRSRAPEPTCSTSKDRLDELDARVEALNLRMQTIQRAVEIQTRILEELKESGALGRKPTTSAGEKG